MVVPNRVAVRVAPLLGNTFSVMEPIPVPEGVPVNAAHDAGGEALQLQLEGATTETAALPPAAVMNMLAGADETEHSAAASWIFARNTAEFDALPRCWPKVVGVMGKSGEILVP